MAIIGIMRQSSPESEDYARINNRVTEIESDIENAITVNGEFDSNAGFWGQVKFDGFTDDAVIVHKRNLTENYGNLEISPAIITQTLVSYSADEGQNFTRITDSYNELIVNGTASVTEDGKTPNFTPLGTSVFNKAKGNVGVSGFLVRIDDVHYPDSELGELGASKSCGLGTIVSRRSDYSQGRHDASYSIGVESVVVNLAEEDGVEGTAGYFGNEAWDYSTWTNLFHGVGGGRRPITAGILFNGKASVVTVDSNGKPVYDAQNNIIKDNGVARVPHHVAYVTNGMYNAIYIGASAMKIRSVPVRDEHGNIQTVNGKVVMTSGNSVETVGINANNWTQAGAHGFMFLKVGYVPRILKSRGSALFESPGAKFLNAGGSMPFAISANGVPYLDFKTGSDSNYYEDPTTKKIPKERPDDTTRARIGYTSDNLIISSDGSQTFCVNRTFTAQENTGTDGENAPTTEPVNAPVNYQMTSTEFYPSSAVNLGKSNKKWDNIYANADVITTSDRNAKNDISDIDEKILKAWGKVNYKIFKFKNGSRKHIGVIAQDIQTAFESEGLDAHDFGLFCEDIDEQGNKIIGVRYSECLALECAYLRSKLGA